MTVALVDGDIVVFRCAASANNDPVDVAIHRADKLMQEILDATRAEQYRCFLSPSKNFRYDLYPEYKANRRDVVDPVHRQAVKDFLVTAWEAEIFDGYEADDALAWSQTEKSIICTIDKDLKQVEGEHYNFVKFERDTITKSQGLQNFYAQVLTGDTSDNLIGIRGIGPVKAIKYIGECYTEQEMFDTVYEMYQDKHQLATNLMCMWLCRQQGETWLQNQRNSGLIIPSEFEPVVVQMYESTRFFTNENRKAETSICLSMGKI